MRAPLPTPLATMTALAALSICLERMPPYTVGAPRLRKANLFCKDSSQGQFFWGTHFMATRRASVIGGTLALAGCGGPPPDYDDPLKGLHNLPASSAPLDHLAKVRSPVALVPGSNMEKLLQYNDAAAKGVQSMLLVNTAALEDGNVQYLITGAVQVLRRRWPDLESVDDLATAARRKFTSSIVLDVAVVLASRTGQSTTARVTAILLDARENPLSRLEASGTTTVGFPAVTPRFQEASNIALQGFQDKLSRYWD